MTALELLDHSANRLLESGLIAHPEMRVRLMSSLAEVLMRIDQTDKAEALLIGAEAVRDRAGLTEGMTPVRLRSALANLAEVKADYVAAEQHYRQAYHQARALLGPDDPEVGRLRTDLAKIILSQGDAARAEPFLQAAMESTRRTLGVQHEHFVNAINALAFAHYAQGEFEQAEHYFRETLRLAFPEQSPDDPSVAVTQNNLALALLRQEKIDEAEDLIQKAIDNFERSLPAGHWRQANARTVLAACHLARGEMETAESMLLAHYPKIVEARGENSPYAKEIRSQIVQLYDRWDRPAEADPFRECPDRPNCPAEDDAGGDPETGS